VVVAYHDYAASQYGAHNLSWSYSSDGGTTFHGPNQPVPVLPDNGNGDFGNVVLARDDNTGTIYFAALADQPPLEVATSVDNAQTFSMPLVVTPPQSIPDKPLDHRRQLCWFWKGNRLSCVCRSAIFTDFLQELSLWRAKVDDRHRRTGDLGRSMSGAANSHCPRSLDFHVLY
jgi:hypothetical protein